MRSRSGVEDGVKSVCGGRAGRDNCGSDVTKFSISEDAWADVVLGVFGRTGVDTPDAEGVLTAELEYVTYSMMLNILDGVLLDVMIVVTPAPVAISAAINFVSIPPVPSLEPSVAVLTLIQYVSYRFAQGTGAENLNPTL